MVVETNFQYNGSLIKLNLDKVLFIIIHHTEAQIASPEEIHNWHIQNGWYGFGYNEYIRKDGSVYIGRGDHIGAQTANLNSKSYGIACEGNYNLESKMPKPQFDALVNRIRYHKKRFSNFISIEKHSRFNVTSCPGHNFPFDEIINKVTIEDLDLAKSLEILKKNGILQSPEYWLKNATLGNQIKGEYGGILINQMARYIINVRSNGK